MKPDLQSLHFCQSSPARDHAAHKSEVKKVRFLELAEEPRGVLVRESDKLVGLNLSWVIQEGFTEVENSSDLGPVGVIWLCTLVILSEKAVHLKLS